MEKDIRLHPLVCPNCNANLQINDGISTYICPYCGATILLEGQSDGELKARVDMAELEFKKYELRHKAIEEEKAFYRKRCAEVEDAKAKTIGFIAIWVFILILIGALFLMDLPEKKVSVPRSSSELLKMYHSEVHDILKKAGFKRISEIQIEGKPGLFSKSDVASISIDGKQSFKSGKQFSPKASVIITFYSDGA